jgi:hypothetical protein
VDVGLCSTCEAVLGALCFVLCALCFVLCALCLVLCAWCFVLGALCFVLGALCLVLGAWCLVLCSLWEDFASFKCSFFRGFEEPLDGGDEFD